MSYLKLIFILVAFLFTSGEIKSSYAKPAPKKLSQFNMLVNKARYQLRNNKPDVALFFLSKAQKFKPLDNNLLLLKGRSLQAMCRYREAAIEYGKYVNRNPKDPNGYLARGIAYMSDNDTRKAIKDFTRAISLRSFVVPYFNRAASYVHIAEYDKAIRDYSTCLKLKPQAVDPRFHRGRIYLLKGEYDKAISDFTISLTSWPNSELVYRYRGQAYEAIGLKKKALADYRKTSLLDEELAESFFTIGKRSGKSNSSLNRMDEFLISGSGKQKTGDYKGAFEDFQNAHKARPDDVVPFCMIGELFLKQKRYDQAILSFSLAWQRNNLFRWSLAGRARAYIAKDDYSRALSDIGKIIWNDPTLPEAYYQRARALEKLKKSAQAKDAYRKYLECAKQFQDKVENKSSVGEKKSMRSEAPSLSMFNKLNRAHMKIARSKIQ